MESEFLCKMSQDMSENRGEQIAKVDVSEKREFDKSQLRVKRIMRLQLATMRVFGLFHERTDCKFIKAYCIFVQIVCWMNFLRATLTFNFIHGSETVFDQHLVRQLVGVAWTFVGASSATLLYIIQEAETSNVDGMNSLIVYCDHLIEQAYVFKKDEVEQQTFLKKIAALRTLSFLSSCLAILFVIFNTSLMIVALLSPEFLLNAFLEYVSPLHLYSASLKSPLVLSVIAVYTIFSAALPSSTVLYFISNSAIVITLMKDFNREFKNFIALNSCISLVDDGREVELAPENPITKETFEKMRQWHVKLCHTVRLMNKCFNKIIAIIIFCMIPALLLILLLLSDPKGNCIKNIGTVAYPFWLFFSSVLVSTYTVTGALINSTIHAPAKDLFDLRTDNLEDGIQFQIQMMTNKLSAERIGITAGHALLLDKQFCLSILTSLITYYFVLVKFKSPNEIPHC